jgi:hypothetical protein
VPVRCLPVLLIQRASRLRSESLSVRLSLPARSRLGVERNVESADDSPLSDAVVCPAPAWSRSDGPRGTLERVDPLCLELYSLMADWVERGGRSGTRGGEVLAARPSRYLPVSPCLPPAHPIPLQRVCDLSREALEHPSPIMSTHRSEKRSSALQSTSSSKKRSRAVSPPRTEDEDEWVEKEDAVVPGTGVTARADTGDGRRGADDRDFFGSLGQERKRKDPKEKLDPSVRKSRRSAVVS